MTSKQCFLRHFWSVLTDFPVNTRALPGNDQKWRQKQWFYQEITEIHCKTGGGAGWAPRPVYPLRVGKDQPVTHHQATHPATTPPAVWRHGPTRSAGAQECVTRLLSVTSQKPRYTVNTGPWFPTLENSDFSSVLQKPLCRAYGKCRRSFQRKNSVFQWFSMKNR